MHMPVWVLYFLKLNVAITFIFLFYQFVLRRLTFYHCNRWFLLGYSLLCLFLPFADIGIWVETKSDTNFTILNTIPSISNLVSSPDRLTHPSGTTVDSWILSAGLILLGSTFMMFRFLFRYYSFRKIKRNAKLLSEWPAKLYQVDDDVVPFSFGNGIFINQNLHAAEEIPEIIRHEFVHVEQKHTLDVLFSEFLCMLIWYNPFVWLLRLSIRQNLEYIADNSVLEKGADKKNYQYLLLKVMSDQPVSITNPFNFSSLKNRIIMMNKIKTARVHLVKFLFALPLLAFLLLAFRNQDRMLQVTPLSSVNDTVPKYAVKPKDVTPKKADLVLKEVPAGSPYTMNFDGNNMSVKLKNGKTEVYDMKKPSDRDKFKNKYGFLPESGEPVEVIRYDVSSTNEDPKAVKVIGYSIAKPATVVSDNGNSSVVEVATNSSSPAVVASGSGASVNESSSNQIALSYSPAKEVSIASPEVGAADNIQTTGEVVLDLPKKMSRIDLDKKIAELKAKGFSFKLNNAEFKDGIITSIDAQISYKDEVKDFKAHDFAELIITSQKTDNAAVFRFYVVKGSLTMN
ncbi:MAG: hypothetical protein C5B52_00815 [Bacteroidetes bacterium]|nr:MAG: hypothetical protein C5B52_00815 [Bacteroidota bacterium]